VQDLRIRTEEFDDLLTPVEQRSDTVCLWAVAPPYVIVNDTIIPQDERQARLTFPLSNPNLFLSFARLGAQGEPSEQRILQWVNRRGLLRGQDRLRESEFAGAVAFGPVLKQHERIVQNPATVGDFRREVRCANQLLRLYAHVRGRDYEAIAGWFLEPLVERSSDESTIVERFLARERAELEYTGELLRLRQAQTVTTRREFGEWNSGTAKSILLGSVAYTVADVRLTLTGLRMPGDQGQESLLARRTMRCPDLLSAIYLQFYLMVTDNKPMRRCENPACGMPFPATPKHKRFCNATCRSSGRYYRSR
jgi:hypothetical protein